jgi:hypothetical protein
VCVYALAMAATAGERAASPRSQRPQSTVMIGADDVALGRILGRGSFGEVYRVRPRRCAPR